MTQSKFLLGPMRVPFLILAPACVLLGYGTAVWTSGQVNVLYLILAVVGAVAAHISVNSFNEYFDFKSGLDSKTQRTPFSGGSGTLQQRPELARYTLFLSIGTLLLVMVIGVYLVLAQGPGLLVVGLLGVLTILGYGFWFSRHPILSLVAPGIGFGTCMVLGTNYVLAGQYSWTALVASLVPFFLVSNLLLLNQFPDVEPDRSVGRRHFPITLGRKKSAVIYSVFLALTYVSVGLGVFMNVLPRASLLGLLTIVLAVPASLGSIRNADNIPKLVPFMGMNVLINLLTPILISVGLFLG